MSQENIEKETETKNALTFELLGLDELIVQSIHQKGYAQPTPIQQQAIPAILARKDVLAAAQTGTGKTAAFVLPILQRIHTQAPQFKTSSKHATQQVDRPHKKVRPIRALILVPTRELASQVDRNIRIYANHLQLKSLVIFGGASMHNQVKQLKHGIDILIATPGRLLDHHMQGTVDLSQVEVFVLDEADRMLDMGFIHDMHKIYAGLTKGCQSLLFSATFSPEIKVLSQHFLRDPQVIEIHAANSATNLVEQTVHLVDKTRKSELLCHLIKENNWQQVLVFTRTKHGANKLTEYLLQEKITALAIHGNKSPSARTHALFEFMQGNLQVLVATDIAARGLHIEQLPYVVNFELPNVAQDYVHRIGRTGRAQHFGKAISLVCVDEHAFLRDIQRLIKQEIKQVTIAGFEPDLSIAPQPIFVGKAGGGGSFSKRTSQRSSALGNKNSEHRNTGHRTTSNNTNSGPNTNTSRNAAENEFPRRNTRTSNMPTSNNSRFSDAKALNPNHSATTTPSPAASADSKRNPQKFVSHLSALGQFPNEGNNRFKSRGNTENQYAQKNANRGHQNDTAIKLNKPRRKTNGS
jgi:ATP-dependent RNA helicase RhlE